MSLLETNQTIYIEKTKNVESFVEKASHWAPAEKADW